MLAVAFIRLDEGLATFVKLAYHIKMPTSSCEVMDAEAEPIQQDCFHCSLPACRVKCEIFDSDQPPLLLVWGVGLRAVVRVRQGSEDKEDAGLFAARTPRPAKANARYVFVCGNTSLIRCNIEVISILKERRKEKRNPQNKDRKEEEKPPPRKKKTDGCRFPAGVRQPPSNASTTSTLNTPQCAFAAY